jgi:hypothetical protein
MATKPKPKADKNPAAVALGRLGGLKGGPARAAGMTAAQRSASAGKAVMARWSKALKCLNSEVRVRAARGAGSCPLFAT